MSLFNVVLHEPEIPNNTGNIGRTCIATGCTLDLIKPLGFSTSEKACRRAGLDYWPRLAPVEHDDWEAFLAARRPARLWFFTTHASRTLTGQPHPLILPGDAIVFGKETRGLPPALMDRYPKDQRLLLPMIPNERSLNLATAVCAVIYLAIDHLQRAGQLAVDPRGRLSPS